MDKISLKNKLDKAKDKVATMKDCKAKQAILMDIETKKAAKTITK